MEKATILIVEDEAIIAADLAGKLGRLGYGISGTTARGEDAVAHAREQRPDLVMMDIRLAGAMDGVEAAEIIRREIDLPVIFLTAHSDGATLERAKLTGPFGYILKPFEGRELATTIEMALFKHQADRKLRRAHDELELRVEERTRELQELNETLERRVAERTAELSAANAMLRDSRLAALNMMEDAVTAHRQAEETSVELRREVLERMQAEDALRVSEGRVRRKLDSILTPEGDIGDLTLADIIDAEAVQALMEDFYRLSHTPVGVVDKEGNVLVGVGWQDICTRFHRVHQETCGNCVESDLQLSAGVPLGEFKLYRCKNNMWDAATPIMIGDRHFGNFFIGQFFFEDEEPDYGLFRTQARQYGFDEEEYLAALYRVPRLSRESLVTGMAYFMKFADMLSKLSYGNLKLARSLAERDTLTESLRRAHDDLETRVAERTEELASAVNILQREIADREQAEDRLLRLNRLYAVLSRTREAIVRAKDRDSLFLDFCRIAVEEGGFLLSWVGLVDGEGRVRAVASHGATGYLDDIRVSVREEAHGRGPTGISAREGTFCICNDFQNDPLTKPWHEKGREYGIGASASVALKQNGRVVGALTLYADARDFFDWQQVELLQQMGEDVSFALENLEREALLRESERKFRTLFEDSKDVIFIMNADGELLDINPAGSELFGHTREEFFALDIARDIYVDPVERERFRKALFSQGFLRDYEVGMKKKNDEALHVLMTASVVRDAQGRITGYRGIIHDVTERKRLEQQLLQAQKMESIGMLAGGVAHDFNNLLTAISGYGQIIQEQFAPHDEMLAMCIEQVLAATERAVELTGNLLAFSRKQIINPQPVRINDIIENLSKLLTRIIGEDIEFGTTLTGRDLTVLADRGQIDQVLINLATNARDAMPNGGQLLIRTERAAVAGETARRLDLSEGAYCLIFVADSGEGMDSETQQRIFEPFFTTKETGKGTGLGLSIIYGIVRQHNGTITVASEPGKGATFTIYLPLVEEAADAAPEEAASAPPRGTETLLLAEDDAMVRRYMRRILEMAGYTVIAAENGAEAVQLYREHRDRVAMVVCDVVMPKKNGKEVYDEIRALDPQARFLFTSGYNDEIIHRKGILLDDIEFLMKPVSRPALLEKLREMLDA